MLVLALPGSKIVRTLLNRPEDGRIRFTPSKLIVLTWQPCLGELPTFSVLGVKIAKKHVTSLQIIFRIVNIDLII